MKERNFRNFNEREFVETINNLNISNILEIEKNEPNFSIENLHNHITFILGEFASFKKL